MNDIIRIFSFCHMFYSFTSLYYYLMVRVFVVHNYVDDFILWGTLNPHTCFRLFLSALIILFYWSKTIWFCAGFKISIIWIYLCRIFCTTWIVTHPNPLKILKFFLSAVRLTQDCLPNVPQNCQKVIILFFCEKSRNTVYCMICFFDLTLESYGFFNHNFDFLDLKKNEFIFIYLCIYNSKK